MIVGENHSNPETAIVFWCMNGYYEPRAATPNTWFYQTTLYNVTIQFSQAEWNEAVTII